MEKRRYRLSRKDKFAIIAGLTLLFGLWVIGPYLPDHHPRTIKRELKKQGYDVNGIEFVRDEQYEDLVYQSSESIFYEDNDVILWLIKRSFHPSTFSRYFKYYVEPYTPPEE